MKKYIFLIFMIIIFLLDFNNSLYNQNLVKGSITINADQDLVDVYVNDKFYGTASGPSTITDLETGNYLIEVKKVKFKTWEKNVQVEVGENKVLKIILEKEIQKADYLFLKKQEYINHSHWQRINHKRMGWDNFIGGLIISSTAYLVWSSVDEIKGSKWEPWIIGLGAAGGIATGWGIYLIIKSSSSYTYEVSQKNNSDIKKLTIYYVMKY